MVTRDAWRDPAVRAGVAWAEVEVVCSAPAECRRRVASRSVDAPDLPLPHWAEVTGRQYEPWDRERIVVDTAGTPPDESPAAPVRVITVHS